MSHVSLSRKFLRIAKFLHGTSRPRVRQLLEPHGFDEAAWREGWERLRDAVDLRMLAPPAPAGASPTSPLESLERKWAPIARAALEARHPAIAAQVFEGYERPRGPALVPMVEALLDRVCALEASPDAEAQAARATLAARGLTAAVVADLRAAIQQVLTRPPPAPAPTPDRAAAEEALEAYFREWSRIARAVVHDRNELRALGFLGRDRAVEDEERAPAPAPVNPAGGPTAG